MPSISSLINAGGRVLGSHSHRRELRAYVRFIAARKCWNLASKEILRTISDTRSGDLPLGLSLPGRTQDDDFNPPFDFPLEPRDADREPEHHDDLLIDLAGTKLEDQFAALEPHLQRSRDYVCGAPLRMVVTGARRRLVDAITSWRPGGGMDPRSSI